MVVGNDRHDSIVRYRFMVGSFKKIQYSRVTKPVVLYRLHESGHGGVCISFRFSLKHS